MAKYIAPPVIGAGLPQAGPSEVPTMVPRKVAAPRDNTDVPGADVPFLQSIASALCRVAVHRPSARCASYVAPFSPTICAQPEPHRCTVHIAAVFPGA